MNAKISVFVICAEEIIYFLLHNLHDCTFNAEYLHLTWHVTLPAKYHAKGNRKP